uniref:Uncharacterized protein n=1 Tax=Nomascus leucogenys TaxID=61853 RepID=A0A2I3HJN1_NOMLE
IIEGWCCILHDPDTVGEEEEKARWAALTHTTNDQKFAQQEEEVSNFIQDSHSAGDSEGQEEGIPGRGAEIGAVDGNLEESIPIEEFDELLQAPEAAFETGHEALGKLVLCSWPLIQVLQYHTDDLHNGQDERAKGQGACVVPRPAKGREEREGWQVVWLAQGPVVGGKGPGQRDLAQRQHEVGQPEEHEGIEDLQAQQGPVVARLTTVEGELATGIGALAGLIGGGEGLWERRENQVQKEAPGVHSGL